MIVGAMFLIPMIPIGIAFAAELTWTVDETVSQGFLLMMSQLFGFVMANVCIVLST
jgi:pyruvate/2-oxoacid:ferredoxin oxidoreductase alpha subunit